MFESIKHWFESTKNDSHLFDHGDQEAVHLALASVLHHTINANHHESKKELADFKHILKQEFDLSDEQVEYLHKTVESANSDFNQDLKTINQHLIDNPMVKKQFMEKLIHLISIDGVLDDELNDFYKALHVIFPEIKV